MKEAKETPMPANITYCDKHWEGLLRALIDAGMQEYISCSDDELHQRLSGGGMDISLEASTVMTRAAIDQFGINGIIEYGGCPLCAFESVTKHVVNGLSDKYITQH